VFSASSEANPAPEALVPPLTASLRFARVGSARLVANMTVREVSREPTSSTSWSQLSCANFWSTENLTPPSVAPQSVHEDAGGVVLTTVSAGSYGTERCGVEHACPHQEVGGGYGHCLAFLTVGSGRDGVRL
jgi:hypothetical protein